MAHEFFHLYNVKAIRPIALGPFDYDRENYTDLLWLSEGVTVYYEDLILNRAGFLPRRECLDRFREHILGYETKPGRRLQSAAQGAETCGSTSSGPAATCPIQASNGRAGRPADRRN